MRAFSRRVFCLLALFAALCLGTNAARAQEIAVTTVRFTNLRPPTGATDNWLEAGIGLEVKPAPGPARMLSRVRVALLIAFELPALTGGERRLEHYRAEAECVALEPGSADVRFYLPPELVKRDQLHGSPKYWAVDLAIAGRAVPAVRGSFSPALADAETRRNFLARAPASAALNDGILLPQYLTPFAHEYPRNTPSFVRRESR